MKSRVLIAVPEGAYYARVFALVARALPNVEFRSVSFSRASSGFLRQCGVRHANVPVLSRAPISDRNVPWVAEFAQFLRRGRQVPPSVQRAIAALDALIGRELADFEPDLVLHGPVDHAACRLAADRAGEASIAILGIQPTYLSGYFLAHRDGVGWAKAIQRARPTGDDSSEIGETPVRRATRSPDPRTVLVLRAIEQLVRLVGPGESTHDAASLCELYALRLRRPPWFPDLDRVTDVRQANDAAVLVLNQPTVPDTRPAWLDLLERVLQLLPPQVPLILRPHPLEPPSPLAPHLRNEVRARGCRMSGAGTGPGLTDLIARCRVVLTVTSTVGYEALLAKAPVVAHPSAFYVRPGLARSWSDASAAALSAPRADATLAPDPREILRFADWLWHARMVSSPATPSPGATPLAERVWNALSESQ